MSSITSRYLPTDYPDAVILTDFDDVWNADYAHRVWGHEKHETTFTYDGIEYPISYSPVALSAFKTVVTAFPRVKTYLSSTWCAGGLEQFHSLGLHLDGKAFDLDRTQDVYHAKLEAFQRAYDTGMRVVWIDDDNCLINQRRRAAHPHALLINPRPGDGITPRHIEMIRTYLENGAH